MLVNLFTYIKDNLPVRLQRVPFIEFIRAMIQQVEFAFNRFHLNIPDWLYRINANASVISLQHHIKRELDVEAIITELDGKPIDFLVSVNGFVNENQLKALIDSYKLAGKSYTFKVGAVVYSAAFGSWECEDIREVWTVEFDEYQCEDNAVVKIKSMLTNNTTVRVYSDSNVATDIIVYGHVFDRNLQSIKSYFNTTIVTGTKEKLITVPDVVSMINSLTSIYYIDPITDGTYEYIIEN